VRNAAGCSGTRIACVVTDCIRAVEARQQEELFARALHALHGVVGVG
jgi:hypothetical protein